MSKTVSIISRINTLPIQNPERGPNTKENSYPENSTNKTAPSVSNPNLNHPKRLRDYGEPLLYEGEDWILLIQ